MTGKTEVVRRYVENRLFEMQDKDYGDFHSRLMPNIEQIGRASCRERV